MATARKGAFKKAAAAKKAAPALKKGVVKKSSTAAASKKVGSTKPRTPNAAFMKAMTPSPALAAVIGAMAVPRTEVTSKLWAYIKKNNLQDESNKRLINADEKLKEVFGKGQVNMFEMTKLVQNHLE